MKLGLQWVSNIAVGLDRGLDVPTDVDEARHECRLDRQLEAFRRHDRVKRAAVGDRHLDAPPGDGHRQAVLQDKAGNILEAHRLDQLVLRDRDRREAARRHVNHHLRPPAGSRDQRRFDRPGDQRDGAVAARSAIAGVVEEDNSELGPVVLRLRDKATVHVGVPARFVHEQLADVVQMLQREAPLLQDGLSPESRHAAADDPKWFAGGVIVHGADHQISADHRIVHRVILTQPSSLG